MSALRERLSIPADPRTFFVSTFTLIALGLGALSSGTTPVITGLVVLTAVLVLVFGPPISVFGRAQLVVVGVAWLLFSSVQSWSVLSTTYWRQWTVIWTAGFLLAVFAYYPANPSARRILGIASPSLIALGLIVITVQVPHEAIDVLELHREAGTALTVGQSPYEGLGIADTSPRAEPGAVIDGYPYPPITLIPYAVASLVFTDPRLHSAALIGVLIVSLGLVARSEHQLRALTLFALVPASALVVAKAWTEPWSLAVIAFAALVWRRNRIVSLVLFGLAFASKQYFFLIVPLILASKFPRRDKLIVLATAGLLALSGFLLGPGYIEATLGFFGTLTPRPDSTNLYSMLFAAFGDIPYTNVPAAIASLTFAGWAGARTRDLPTLLRGIATTLAIFFFSSQAFPNYWYLVLGLALIAETMTRQPVDRVLRQDLQ